jgi:hypothetical protein
MAPADTEKMKPEYDFSDRKGGIRGNYYKKYREVHEVAVQKKTARLTAAMLGTWKSLVTRNLEAGWSAFLSVFVKISTRIGLSRLMKSSTTPDFWISCQELPNLNFFIFPI